jgi:pyrroloquinoline quinone biosynthesis protein B
MHFNRSLKKMKRYYFVWLIVMLAFSCDSSRPERKPAENSSEEISTLAAQTAGTSMIVLGTIQDAGSPHIGCSKECCADLFENPDPGRRVVSLGVYDAQTGKKYLFEATPDMPEQMKALKRFGVESGSDSDSELADGIFITHAHIGHYTGLMYLGKEAINSQNVPVYVMPGMSGFITGNAPWNQLVTNGNIELQILENETPVQLSDSLEVTPFLVPHRDELSETVGFIIRGPRKKVLFIPDIDKWHLWERNIIDEIRKVDYAFLDATFYSGEEINRRDISQIPHPSIIESLELFSELSMEERQKVCFIHFNHTNPVLNSSSREYMHVLEQGFRLAGINEVFGL